MHTETLSFVGSAGARLAGILRTPDTPAAGSALLAHCFTCGKDLHTLARLARRLTEAGWVTLTFDFTGLGDSEGSFTDTTMGTSVGDLSRAAVALLERNSGPCLLLGHSLGGSAAVLAAHRLHTVTSLVCIGSPVDVAHVRHLFVGAGAPDHRGAVEVDIGGRPFRIGADFQTDLDTHDVESAAAELDIPVLVVEAGADSVVPVEQTRRLAAAPADSTLVTIPDADHLFTAPAHADQLATVVLTWLSTRDSA